MNPINHIIIIGAGIVGRTIAQCTADMTGAPRITCIEPNDARRTSARLQPRISISNHLGRHIQPAQLYFITVGTPPTSHGACDTSAVIAAAQAIQAHLTDAATIVIKSTVPPGTAQRVANLFCASAPPVNVLSNPEFLTESNARQDFLNPARVLIGACTPEDAAPLLHYYTHTIGLPRVRIQITTPRTAEAAKYVSNAMLAARVAHYNELSDWAKSLGADPQQLAAAVGDDPRIGAIYASNGYAGRCLPKDVAHLLACHEPQLPALASISALNTTRLHRAEK